MSELESEINSMPTIREIPGEMLPSEQVLEEEAEERKKEEERRRNRIPPVIFGTIDVRDHSLYQMFVYKITKMCFFRRK